jgi:hypothetical protein
MVSEKASFNVPQCIANWYPIYRVPAEFASMISHIAGNTQTNKSKVVSTSD